MYSPLPAAEYWCTTTTSNPANRHAAAGGRLVAPDLLIHNFRYMSSDRVSGTASA
jgi:hypothetical protein